MKETADVIIVGAGIAGSALAARLGELGARVLIFDRHEEARPTLAGELLQPGGVETLRNLHLEHCVEGIEAQEVLGFAVVDTDTELQQRLPYPESKSEHPTRGYAFHYHRFVQRLRDAFFEHPNVTFVQGLAHELLIEEGRVCGIKMRGQEDGYRAHLTVLASGRSKHLMSQVKSFQTPQRIAYSVGLKLHDVQLPFPNHGHVFFTRPSPTLGYQIDPNCVRLLVDIPGELPRKGDGSLARYLREEICPQLPQEVQEAALKAIETGDIQSIQNCTMIPETPKVSGVALLGDALSMRHPLTGGGMTVALNDAHRLVEALLGKTSTAHIDVSEIAHVDAALRTFYRDREPMAATIDILSGALYEIFKADRPGLALMRDAVMRYWQLGGLAVTGPMSLLAGLRPSPTYLLLHFCAVALLGMGTHIAPLPNSTDSSLPIPRLNNIKESSKLLLAAVETMGHQVQRGLRLIQR